MSMNTLKKKLSNLPTFKLNRSFFLFVHLYFSEPLNETNNSTNKTRYIQQKSLTKFSTQKALFSYPIKHKKK